jgi:hypothetical protein
MPLSGGSVKVVREAHALIFKILMHYHLAQIVSLHQAFLRLLTMLWSPKYHQVKFTFSIGT